MTSRFVPVLSAALSAALASTTFAGSGGGWKAFRDPTVQDFGHQWSTVGDPNNPSYFYDHPQPGEPDGPVGRTNYKYRIMTREVTAGEWFEFVEAYAPYVAFGTAQSPGLLGDLIQYHGYANGLPQYSLPEQNENRPMRASWRMAARYANWLHNGQTDAAWAFETGVYDSSTFGTTIGEFGNTILTDQRERAEGSRFWIPSSDEWTKAGHWDPDRYGEGEGGWWQYPTTSDTAPIPGHPDFGGQTNGGTFPQGQTRPLDVGSYPDVQSPWGLLDVSGGAHEWLEDIYSDLAPNSRLAAGTTIYNLFYQPAMFDALGVYRPESVGSLVGIRLASVVPSPGAFVALGWLLVPHRRRSKCECRSSCWRSSS